MTDSRKRRPKSPKAVPEPADSPVLKDLNPEQREAVLHGDGPLLIFAGAGSGKTRVLTHRAAYLVRHRGVPPQQILAVTFTNKAANEMKERIARLVGPLRRDFWMGTFHSICARILRYDGGLIGVDPNFVVFDESDQLALMKDVFKDLGLDPERLQPASVLNEISRAKNELIAPRNYQQTAANEFERTASRAYTLYQARLAENKALDFDDLIMFAVRLFEEHAQVLEAYQERFRYILVDEYQDINFAQYRLIALLARKHRNLTVVGDDDQSIYGWRGADMRIILRFEEDYPDAQIVKLERNYRSTKNILDAAWHVINRNLTRKPKRLWTDVGDGPPLNCTCLGDEHQEAMFVAQTIQELAQIEGLRFADFAVLYRMNAQSRVFEQVFLGMGLPYRIVGGLCFWERAEIKDILGYLRLVFNPDDTVSLQRVISVPPRGIGKVTLNRLLDAARERRMSPFQALLQARHLDLAARQTEALGEFARLLRGLIEEAPNLSVTDLTTRIIERTGYLAHLEQDKSYQARGRAENVRELLSATGEFEEQSEDATLGGFLEQVALLADPESLSNGEAADAVPLMTLHSAKGLEFPVVFLVGLEEGIFPVSRAVMSDRPADLEEERRLCYVGITRAQQRLFLTHARTRTLFGATSRNPQSRFLDDLPENLVEGPEPARQPISWESADSARSPEADRILAQRAPGDQPFAAGERVHHAQWGEGIVINTKGEGPSALVTVAFPKQGVKKLVVQHAPLTRVS